MIIKSLLDTDLYKLTMQQFAYHFLPKKKKKSVYSLKCRSDHNLLSIYKELKEEIKNFQSLTFKKEEIDYLRSLNLFKEDYLEFLKEFSFNRTKVKISKKNGELSVRVIGDWKYSILYEVPVLAIIQELYFKKINTEQEIEKLLINGREKLNSKIALLKSSEIKISEFGTRRRFSFDWQKEVSMTLKKNAPQNLLGTSNVLLAKELGLSPIGTMAHEYLSAMQGLDFIPFEMSQKYALEMWNKEHEGKLSIALTDIFSIDSFLHDLDYNLLNKYDGFRHDSGCPYLWGERIVNHCIGYGVNPMNKKLIFSDNLNIEKSIALHNHFNHRIPVSFGIGTDLTNDFDAHKPMSLVMKLVNFNEKPVIKVSDEPSKLMCEDEELVKKALNYISTTKKKENTYPVISTCVDVIIKNNEKYIFIQRGAKDEAEFKKLAMVGGYLDINETCQEAIQRELKEEIGVIIELNRFKFLTYKDGIHRDPRRRNISLVFLIELSNEELKGVSLEEKEVLSLVSLSKEEIFKNDFAFDHKEVLMDFLGE